MQLKSTFTLFIPENSRYLDLSSIDKYAIANRKNPAPSLGLRRVEIPQHLPGDNIFDGTDHKKKPKLRALGGQAAIAQ